MKPLALNPKPICKTRTRTRDPDPYRSLQGTRQTACKSLKPPSFEQLRGCSDASVVEELLGELDWQGLTPNMEAFE